MAKASLKKPKLTPQEQLAELVRLTGSVAAISHVGPTQPFVLATVAAPPVASAPAPVAEPVGAAAEEPAAVPEPPAPDFAALFAASGEKKTFQVRITASHQQFFQQLGVLLGAGASSADVIHNILAAFRAANEEQLQKALQQQLAQLLLPKK